MGWRDKYSFCSNCIYVHLNAVFRELAFSALEWHRFCDTRVSWIEDSGLWEHPISIQVWIGLDIHPALECWGSKIGWGVLP